MATTWIATSFLYFFFRNPDALICTLQDRTASCSCLSEPVCALYSCTTSPTGYCQQTMINGCTACLDETVLGVIFGECSDTNVQSCSEEHRTTSCRTYDVEGTVCGVNEVDTTNPSLSRTLFNTGCQACNSGGVPYYLAGEAFGQCLVIDTSTICREADRDVSNCPTDVATMACSYYTGGDCTLPLCRKTTTNYCFACEDPNVLFYLNGSCEQNVPLGPEGSSPEFGNA